MAKVLFVKYLMAAVMLVGISGCFNMTPDYHQPALDISQPESFRNASVSGPALVVDEPWWREFGNPEIDKLVEEVLHRNWDVRLAAARILEARWNVTFARADRFPFIGLDGRADRRKIGGPRVESGLVFNTLEMSIPATFELDLWGRLAAAEKAARYSLLLEEENRRAVAHTVIAETVVRYFEMEAIERRLRIARQSISAFVRSLDFVQRRYRHGLSSVLAVRQARRILAEAEAIVPDLEQQLGSTQQQIAVLLGRYPSTRPAQVPSEDYFIHLPPVPAGLTSELLQRRPDIRAAEARLKAANERIGAAKAARFPDITLTGRYGYSSDELTTLINPGTIFWNLTAGLTQPIFDAGKLKAAQRSAEARYRQEVAQYAKAVLQAFFEVEEALLVRQKQLERRHRLLKFLKEARATQRIAQNRYLQGLVDYLTVLDAQQNRFTAEERVVAVEAAILTNRVRLHRVLGGSWGQPPLLKTMR